MWIVEYTTLRSGIKRTVTFSTANAEQYARKRYEVETTNNYNRRVILYKGADKVIEWTSPHW